MRTSTLNPSAREWFPPGYQTSQSAAARAALPLDKAANTVNTDAAVFLLGELPMEILSSVAGFLESPQDLLSCILANQQLQAAVRSARMRFQLQGRPRQLLSFPYQSKLLDDLVHALTRYMPAMAACNLSMLPLEHRHVSKLSQSLPLLQHLDLSGCKKLQPSMTHQLLQGLSSRQLQSLNLQRCFQLTDTCLTDVLEYACANHSSSKSLQCIALSHLNLAAWPAASGESQSAQDTQINNSAATRTSSSSSSSSSGSSDTEHSSSDADSNNRASSSSGGVGTGSTAHQWLQVAQQLLLGLPKQLGLPLLASGSAAALRVVVLNNCTLLPASGLVSLAVACPQLEYLFLGGSTLKAPDTPAAAAGDAAAQPSEAAGVYVPRSVAAAAAAAAGAGGGSARGGSDLPAALQQLAELLQLPATLPWEVLSSCCGTNSCSAQCGQDGCSCPCSCCTAVRDRARQARFGSNTDDGQQERARKRLHRNEPSAAAVATARHHALSLARVAALLPCLRAIEATFMAPGLAGWLEVCLDKLQQLRQQQQQDHQTQYPRLFSKSSSLPGSALTGLLRTDSSSSSAGSSRGSASGSDAGVTPAGPLRPKVWQLTCGVAVVDALHSLSDARMVYRSDHKQTADSASSSAAAAPGGAACGVLSPVCFEMAIKCAANCSSRGRSTPLHMAADAGCACHIRVLVSAGAAVAARDASGASPLFVACESGRAAAAAELLQAGADALVGNTAGETPLYIAALRGHLSVVELLLGHLSAAEVDWTQRQLYGDAWTPLMAAAVANRVNVALCLLRAAATCCCDSKAPRPGLVDSGHQHRGGCSAGACHGVTRLLAAENRYGQTVLHIAARKGCRELLQLLLLYGAGQVAGRVADAAGDTPLDIARRHGHEMAVRELLAQC